MRHKAEHIPILTDLLTVREEHLKKKRFYAKEVLTVAVHQRNE